MGHDFASSVGPMIGKIRNEILYLSKRCVYPSDIEEGFDWAKSLSTFMMPFIY